MDAVRLHKTTQYSIIFETQFNTMVIRRPISEIHNTYQLEPLSDGVSVSTQYCLHTVLPVPSQTLHIPCLLKLFKLYFPPKNKRLYNNCNET